MAMKKIKKKIVKKVEQVDTSKKFDELLNKAKLVVPGAEKRPKDMEGKCPHGWRSTRRGVRMSIFP